MNAKNNQRGFPDKETNGDLKYNSSAGKEMDGRFCYTTGWKRKEQNVNDVFTLMPSNTTSVVFSENFEC